MSRPCSTARWRACVAGPPRRGDARLATEARNRIVAANRADPDDPRPLILFHDWFIATGQPATANAVVGLNRALELAPHDGPLRFRVARQQLIDGKLADARRTLEPLVYGAHGGPGSKGAAALTALIDAGDREAIRKALQSPDMSDDTEVTGS
jgi:hypothetical protein